MSYRTFRLLDANFNRAAEGLRVLEDIARFILGQESLCRTCKHARHELARLARPYDALLVSERDSVGDVGRRESAASPDSPRDLLAVVRANAKRVEESLRVIEELARGGAGDLVTDHARIEHLRYTTYELEKELVTALLQADTARQIQGLYVVVDAQVTGSREMTGVTRDAISGGAGVIQLRDKFSDKDVVYREACAISALCKEQGVLFVVNDHADVAAAVGAPAVHVGQKDLPVAAVKRIVAPATVVGVSCHSRDDVLRAVREGADYIAVGSIFPTSQKQEVTVVGLDLLRWARERAMDKPVVAIGGITAASADKVLAAGADAIAVISAVTGQEDVVAAARELCAVIEQSRGAES